MSRISFLAAAFLMIGVTMATGPVRADDVGVGIEASFTGPFSIWGHEYREGIELYLDKIHHRVGTHTIKIYYGDDGGMDPPRAKQLAQAMVVRDNVAVLGGSELTPDAVAVTQIINETKTPYVLFNTGTGDVTDKSPYFVRVGFTQWSNYYPLGEWAAKIGHYQRCVGIAANYAAGVDSMNAVKQSFEANGGKIVDMIMTPTASEDFTSYIARIRNDHPQCTFVFMPLGPQSAAFVKGYAEAGLPQAGVQFLGTGETWEPDLPLLGDAALGIVTAHAYEPNLDNPTNHAFVAAFKKVYNTNPTDIAVLAYDGMRVIAQMVAATDGKRDGDKAVAAIKGLSWESPRGPVSIDPATRELTQNIYIRRVEKQNGKLVNAVIYTVPNVKEMWHQFHK